MKKFSILFLTALVVLSCDKNSALVGPGGALGQAYVTASAGSLSVSVETQGSWNVRVEDGFEWVKTDVFSNVGNAAFTLYYDDNVSVPGSVRRSRRASIVIATQEYGRADTLYLVQQGIVPVDYPKVTPVPGPVQIDFEQAPLKTLRILYASADGVDADAVKNWGVSQGYDLIACGNRFLHPAETGGVGLYAITDFSGIRFLTIDLASVAENDRPAAFRQILDENYTPASPSGDWILGGQLYHLSMMQTPPSIRTAMPGTSISRIASGFLPSIGFRPGLRPADSPGRRTMFMCRRAYCPNSPEPGCWKSRSRRWNIPRLK